MLGKENKTNPLDVTMRQVEIANSRLKLDPGLIEKTVTARKITLDIIQKTLY